MAAAIFPKVKQEIEAIVVAFNGSALSDLKGRHQMTVEFEGKFIYLKLQEGQRLLPSARLE